MVMLISLPSERKPAVACTTRTHDDDRDDKATHDMPLPSSINIKHD